METLQGGIISYAFDSIGQQEIKEIKALNGMEKSVQGFQCG